jgi:hypothetical protein
MLAARLDAHGIRYTSVGLRTRGSTPIAQVTLLPGADAASVRAALKPFGVEVIWSDAVWIERLTEATRDGTVRAGDEAGADGAAVTVEG